MCGVGPGIDAVIDGAQVTSVFQPIVDLIDGTVMGYEALSRGPAGTALATPLALLDAANSVGRIGELDWLMRATAVRSAEHNGVARYPLFVNVEPRALGTPCPDHLRPLRDRSATLPLVAEFTERALADDPSTLLAAAAAARRIGWGIALDDVGAHPDSMALLPFLAPDVIKLDLRLIQSGTDGEIAMIANAVHAHAERSGAVVIAEGIESARQASLARVFGARWGQGWHFGRPSAVPHLPTAAAAPAPRARTEPIDVSATPFELVSAERRPTRAAKSLLLPMSRHLEEMAAQPGYPMTVLGCFQQGRNLTPATRRRYAQLATGTVFTAVLGVDTTPGRDGSLWTVDLAQDDPLGAEWNVIVVGPYFAGTLTARRCGGENRADPDFEFILTHDRDLTVRAARSVLCRVGAGRASIDYEMASAATARR